MCPCDRETGYVCEFCRAANNFRAQTLQQDDLEPDDNWPDEDEAPR